MISILGDWGKVKAFKGKIGTCGFREGKKF
jgi:hypothetical protein